MTATAELATMVLDMKPEAFEATALQLDEAELVELDRFMRSREFEAFARNRHFLDRPAAWMRERLNEHPWSKQREIMRSVRDNRYTAVPSAHGVGKSYIAARIVAWWLETHAPGDAFVVTTAPTGDQVRGVLWREINRAHERGGLTGRVNLSQWYIGNELVAIGRKPANTNPAAFQGLHARFILVVIDEADGVADAIFDAAADTLATNENARVLAIGNPDRGQGPFFKACQRGSGWHVIRISAFNTPAFTGEPVPDQVLEVLTSRAWEAEKRAKWGVDDPRYKSKVLAEAPADNPLGVVPWSALASAMVPRDEDDPWPDERLLPREGGIDPGASEGGDKTVCWVRYGVKAVDRLEFRESDPEVSAGKLLPFIQRHQLTRVKVDVIGVGWGLAGFLNQQRSAGLHNAEVVRVNVSESGAPPSHASPGFPHVRDQIWWEVGRGNSIGQGGAPLWDLSILEGDEYDDVVAELIEPTWVPDGQGRIHVEPKKETKKRLGRSPDNADALLLAYWSPITKGEAYGSVIAQARL